MASSRYLRKLTFRVCTTILRREVNCISATCLAIIIFFVITLAINMTRPPTIMTLLDKAHFDWKVLEKDYENLILIEHHDGNVYIAIQMNESSKVLKDIKAGNLHPIHKEAAAIAHTETALIRSVYPVTVQDDAYNINSKSVCKTTKHLSFLVIVHSATLHFMRRSSIRETWANFKLFKGYSMRIIFVLGKPEKDSTQALIEHEAVVNKDIIQGKFLDTYKNLTHKGVLGLRWISEYCPEAKIIVKVDDDVFLNVFKLMEEIHSTFENKTRSIWCTVRYNGTSEIQRKKGKWKIDDNEFKNMTHFPVTYCNGFFTMVSSDIIKEMYEAAKVTPFFWVDDVYLFGLLPDKIGNVNHYPLLNLNLNEKHASSCFDSKDRKCELLVANAHSDGVMDTFWFSALRQYKTLAQKYSKDGLFL